MNKKLQKGLVAAVAATLSTGIVAPVYAASVETKSFDAQYAEAYNATVNAKTQKELTAARVLVDKLYADLPQDLKNLAATLSAILDPKQQTELVKLDNAIKAAEVSGKQTDVNVATALIVDMPTVWKTSFSSYMDKIQQAVINKAVVAVTKAQVSGVQADLDAAKVLYAELLTVTNNDGVKSWVETALKAELDKVVVLSKVASVSAINSTQAVVTFTNEVSAADATNFTVDNGLSVVSAAINTADKTKVTLTFNQQLTDNQDYKVTANGVTGVNGVVLNEDSSATFVYAVGDVTKIELTKSVFISGDEIANDFVKVTNNKGVDVTDQYTVEVSSTSLNITSGVVGTITSSEVAYVQVTVKDGSGDVVTTSDAFKVTLSPTNVSSVASFGLGTLETDVDTYKTDLKNGDLTSTMKVAGTPYLNVLVNNNGSEALLDFTNATIVNLTPAIASVDATGRVKAFAAGTAQVKLTVGTYSTTVSFTVQANSSVKDATLSSTSVYFNTGDLSTTTKDVTVNLLDQYSKDYSADIDATGAVSVSGVAKGTLSVKSSNNNVATVAIGAATATNELPLTITEGSIKGTATITVTYKNTSGTVIFTKTLNVTVKEAGSLAGYVITTSANAIDLDNDTDESASSQDDSVTFTVYSVDASGNRIEEVPAVLSIQGYDNDPDVETYIDVVGQDVKVISAGAYNTFAGTGTLNVDVLVNGVKVGTKAITYKNTDPVATKATINTAAIVIDNDKIDGSANSALTVADLILGHYDTAGAKYTVAPKLSIVDQNGTAIALSKTIVGDLANGDSTSISSTGVVYTITNESNVTNASGSVTLDAGKTSGSFTVVISSVKTTNETSNMLAAPVAFTVTIVD